MENRERGREASYTGREKYTTTASVSMPELSACCIQIPFLKKREKGEEEERSIENGSKL